VTATPTTHPLSPRLRELSDAVTQGCEAVAREFTMRVPAEPDRDADLVLSRAADALDAVHKADQETGELRQSLNFYRSRCDLLQQWQARMRDPERTLVCDILANGATLSDPHGERYTPASGESADEGTRLRAEVEALRRLAALAREIVPALEATGLNVSLAADVRKALDAARTKENTDG